MSERDDDEIIAAGRWLSIPAKTLRGLRDGSLVAVPKEIIDRFPEINPSNYDHDDACALNAWGVEVVFAAAQEPTALDPLQRYLADVVQEAPRDDR